MYIFHPDQMFVFYPENEMGKTKVGIGTIKTYCKRMQEENIHRAIIVVQTGMTPSAKQVCFSLKVHFEARNCSKNYRLIF